MDVKFNIGDWIYNKDVNSVCVVDNVDKFTEPIPQYYLHMVGNPSAQFWSYCFGWEKVNTNGIYI